MAEFASVTNRAVSYFPLPEHPTGHRMDTRAGVTALVQVEEDQYAGQCREKRVILESVPDYHFQCPPDTLPAAWAAIGTLLPDLACHYPQHFTLHKDGDCWTWVNRLLPLRQTFVLGDLASLPLSPLDWLGRQLQEDLLLMRQDEDKSAILAAGHLCFAAGWCLNDKRDQPFLTIHEPVPGFNEAAGAPADKLLRRLKAGRPIERINWSLAGSDHLNRAPRRADVLREAETGITSQNAPDRVHFRVERQTLSRLPHTGAILFTIHTYLNPLRDVLDDAERAKRLYRSVTNFSEATVRYKGMTGYYDALVTCLAQAASIPK